jgi:lysyl-tRNA synthetase class 2
VTAASPFWDRQAYEDRRPLLRQRARLSAAVRGFFAAADFAEVETAILQTSPGNEVHLHALSTAIHGADGTPTTKHLHTSPEFSMKKLLAAGESRIVTFARVFRDRERTALHHPEFTMLEWYRADEPYGTLMRDCAALLALAATTAGSARWHWRGRQADPFAAPERLSVAAAFERHAGIDLLATLDGIRPDRDRLARAASGRGVRCAADDDWSDIFSRILVECIEPRLGLGRPTILDRYPAAEAALARPCADDPRVAERFELYVCGMELANAFIELTDAAEQRARFAADRARRHVLNGETDWPLDEEFLAALEHGMPPAGGVAMGFDRLAMIASGADRIDQVKW